ncbi:hypothetical protein GE278_22775 (plasmid) [Enterobacteriaceae bacterium Kacie_13]|nr:hypothetical protein GE278_22775 [Enterobacteriaceae bacterium Kacie_13]
MITRKLIMHMTCFAMTGGYRWLDDHAADSPIVFRRNQATASAAILYTF